MYDVVIIGAGPAGISASLYSKRAGLNVLVLYYGISDLAKTDKIDNYYGFENGITGKELYESGIKQAKNLGIDVLEKEVINVEISENLSFFVKTKDESYKTKALIIATGSKKIRPNIEGIIEFEGRGISYCAICDGFFYRNKNVAIIGNGEFALSEAKDLENIANTITILTNGEEAPIIDKYKIDTRKIKRINGEEKVSQVEFEDGEKTEIDGIFIAEGVAGGSNFAKKLGIITKEDNSIDVNENMKTNIEGIFACGDITGGFLQVNKAVYEGAKAGLEVVKYIKEVGK